MLRYMFILGAIAFAAVAFSDFVSDNPDMMRNAESAVPAPAPVPEPVAKRSTQPVALSGTERLRADRRGHHVAEFRLNNHRVMGMIDTGATTIAINESTARRAGIRLSRSDFVYQVQTANGTVNAARATLDEVRVGSIRIRNVEAMVLGDNALSTVLIGMSFMNRLRSFSYEGGTLVLKL